MRRHERADRLRKIRERVKKLTPEQKAAKKAKAKAKARANEQTADAPPALDPQPKNTGQAVCNAVGQPGAGTVNYTAAHPFRRQ